MIFAAQPGWSVVGHGVRVAADGPPLHFFDVPIVAWRTKGETLIPMTYEEGVVGGSQWAVAAPDGKVSTGEAARLSREEYEARVISASPLAKEEMQRRQGAKRVEEFNAEFDRMTQRRTA
jgi:hypothetical protein